MRVEITVLVKEIREDRLLLLPRVRCDGIKHDQAKAKEQPCGRLWYAKSRV